MVMGMTDFVGLTIEGARTVIAHEHAHQVPAPIGFAVVHEGRASMRDLPIHHVEDLTRFEIE